MTRPLRLPIRCTRALLCVASLHGCAVADGTPVPPGAYPDGPYGIADGATLPDLQFPGITEAGALGTVSLHDYYTPERRDLVLLVVNGGLWCGTCRWPAEHARDLLDDRVLDRVRRLDLVLGDRDNAAANARTASEWQRTFEGLEGVAVGADPAFRLRDLVGERDMLLPLIVLIDSSTMQTMAHATNPSPWEIRRRVDRALAALDGRTTPSQRDESLVDGVFHENEWALLETTTLPEAPRPDPTNAVADSEGAANLGRALFFDEGLSPSGTVSCATCHRPDRHLSDGRRRARGVAEGDRRTPSIALAAHARWQFWDGRADSLWSQALGPLEDAREFNSSRVFVARHVLLAHGSAYRAAFPDAPIPDVSSWPSTGKPGETDYDTMSDEAKTAATRVFVHAGKAIAAWERTFRVEPNPLDAYLEGNFNALSPEQKFGLALFVRRGCLQCHWGPRLTDDAFHDIRAPTGRHDGQADRGRIDGIIAWQASEFSSNGMWSDAPGRGAVGTSDPSLLGKFKTPPLRGVADAATHGHGGTFEHLAEVTEAYGRGGVPPDDPTSAGTREPWIASFGETVQWGLVPFLELLTARLRSDVSAPPPNERVVPRTLAQPRKRCKRRHAQQAVPSPMQK